jgi:hypothetical protein
MAWFARSEVISANRSRQQAYLAQTEHLGRDADEPGRPDMDVEPQ